MEFFILIDVRKAVNLIDDCKAATVIRTLGFFGWAAAKCGRVCNWSGYEIDEGTRGKVVSVQEYFGRMLSRMRASEAA